MPDLTTTLAVLKGQQESLKRAKSEVDAAAERIDASRWPCPPRSPLPSKAFRDFDSVGFYSSVDQLLRSERFAGKAVSVDFVKANPHLFRGCAIAAWDAAGKVATAPPCCSRTRPNLKRRGLSAQPPCGAVSRRMLSWESQRLIIATDRAASGEPMNTVTRSIPGAVVPSRGLIQPGPAAPGTIAVSSGSVRGFRW